VEDFRRYVLDTALSSRPEGALCNK
jgi:hypothetical protein